MEHQEWLGNAFAIEFSSPIRLIESEQIVSNFGRNVSKDLSGNQTDCRGIIIQRMKREVTYENPDDNSACFCDIMKMSPVLAGSTTMPNPGKQPVLFFGIHPNGWREKFTDVP